jgi:3-methylcrotonyl-CoA carboxylase alpha subunit
MEARMMRLRVGTQVFPVSVGQSGGRHQVEVGEETFTFRAEPISPGTFVLWIGDRIETLHFVRDGANVHFFFEGRAYRLQEEGEGARSSSGRAFSGGLEAPMPGKVIKVNVRPGQAVVQGEEILIVEAMKMENAVRAPRAGTVKTVSVKEGEMVAPGTVLVELS